MPLHLPGDATGSEMPLFSARIVHQSQAPAADASGAASSSSSSAPTCLLDGILHVGGLVWAADWCPSSPATQSAPQQTSTSTLGAAARAHADVLALSVHPGGQLRTARGQPCTGPGAVQLWSVPRSSQAPGHAGDGLPQPLACLLHDGVVCWDLRWCPDATGLVAGPGSDGRWAPAHSPALD